ncbi:MAG: adenylyltransferase [Candidatus Marinimicrobia bacterium]|nr:adenylyltransferase [Candidatus Neomarinimicrobiota bacterium]
MITDILLKEFKEESAGLNSLVLTDRQLCDIELIMSGAFAPLKGFLGKDDYDSVVNEMRLSSGEVWPIPITLDVDENYISHNSIEIGSKIALREKEGFLIAFLTISDIWNPDKKVEAEAVFKSNNAHHPGVNNLLNITKSVYIGGELTYIQQPKHYDYPLLRHTPSELKSQFEKMGWEKIVAFQTRNPMHRAHKEIAYKAATEVQANLLIHPVVGQTKPGDIDHFTRVRCYQKILNHFPEGTTMLSLLPLSMRMAGPREALWHGLIRKNYGCTHIVIGRDHAGPGKDENGNDYYGPYEAQDLLKKYSDEIGIEMVEFKMMVYVEEKAEYMPIDSVPKDLKKLNISGTELRHRLENHLDIPEWFTYPEIVDELKMSYPSKENQGLTLFFTGLSGSGKSTIANGLMVKLKEYEKRAITLLDGDIVRTHLSSELGFSKEHRDLNITRIGFVASEITKNGGIAICAPIAPYEQSRETNRQLISNYGNYIEIHISTPLETCERRDTKGLYAMARQGKIKGFTGIDDPYETPKNPSLEIDTTDITEEEAIQKVILYLEKEGYIS